MSNHLADSTSPYLQQHQDNPVEWYPWGEAALEKAKNEGKPILLSIGYSACHWCHVMAHESFEDKATADILNKYFVNIKVDREERPDLDKIYQLAHYFITQSNGGWPLTMFLTAEQVPFFGGTYFPKNQRHGLPSFTQVLAGVISFYYNPEKQTELASQNQSILQALRNITLSEIRQGELDPTLISKATGQLAAIFDSTYGGFGRAPKFPHPAELLLLVRHNQSESLAMLTLSLDKMASGGLYDQLAGGFYRYSVDDQWRIPHFEKMLYDNGTLVHLYSVSYLTTKNTYYLDKVMATCDWIISDMQSEEGGYFSSRDADSEGQEGKFYLWKPEDFNTLLDEAESAIASTYWGLSQAANFENQYWHLCEAHSLENLAQQFSLPISEIENKITTIRQQLLAVRAERIAPARDEKILTAWNGLMIQGMVTAARTLPSNQTERFEKYLNSAYKAIQCIQSKLWQQERLLVSYKDGQANYQAYLDDYAFLLMGLLDYLQLRWDNTLWDFAEILAKQLYSDFYDAEQGGFYFTAKDHEALIQRPKPFADEAIPAGSGIAALALVRLGYLTANHDYITAAENTVRAVYDQLTENPSFFCSMLAVLDEIVDPGQIIILRGEENKLKHWQALCSNHYNIKRLCFAIPNHMDTLPASLADKVSQGEITAYICQGSQCDSPISDEATFISKLNL